MSSIEFQHVTGAWMITDYDSPNDEDALPEQVPLKGTCTFRARFDTRDRAKAIHVPDEAGSYLLSIREMEYAVVHGRLQDRQARDGVMLPVLVGGVPIVWTVTPDLQEDPGVGITGAKVAANTITFGPADPDGNGIRRLNLADIADTNIEYPDPVISRMAVLVKQVIDARDEVEGFVQFLTDDVVPEVGSLVEAAREHSEQAGRYAQDAFDAIPPATDTQLGKLKLRGALAGTAEEPLIADEVIDFEHLSTTELAPGAGSIADAVGFAAQMLGSYLYNQGWSRETLAQAVRDELDSKADLDSGGKLVQAQVPSIAISDHLGTVNSQAAMLALVGERGDWCIRNDRGTVWVVTKEPSNTLSSWVEWVYPVSPVDSINGRKGAIELAAVDILDSTVLGRTLMKVANAAAIRAAAGLDRVENTRDMDKPVSTAAAQVFADFESAVSSRLDAKVGAAGLTAGLWTGISRPATGTTGIVYLEF